MSEFLQQILTLSDFCARFQLLEVSMTDGPFNNLKLGSCWKRFAEAVQNDAVDEAVRCAVASDALLREMLTEETETLLADLHTYGHQEQLDFDPLSSVENIFNGHSKTPFADTLQKELAFRLSEQMLPDAAITQAVEATVGHQISGARSRIEEECIRARESGEMRQDQFDRTVREANAAFDALAKDKICDALRAGDRTAFTSAVSKKEGLDEGPGL
jgi:hypothetical protein